MEESTAGAGRRQGASSLVLLHVTDPPLMSDQIAMGWIWPMGHTLLTPVLSG